MAGPTGTNASRGTGTANPATTRRPSAATVPAASSDPASPAAAAAPNAAATLTIPVVVAEPAPRAVTSPEAQSLMFGMGVVLAGFVSILIGLWLVVINYKTAADAMAILGIVTTAIAGVGGTVFGVAIGQLGVSSANKQRAAAEAAKDEAQAKTLKFAAYMDPTVARRLVE
jgi:uncharacterized membrane protein YccF (DUF307 family)